MPALLPAAIAASSILWYSKVTCSISAIVNLERIADDTGIVFIVEVDDNLALFFRAFLRFNVVIPGYTLVTWKWKFQHEFVVLGVTGTLPRSNNFSLL